MNVDELQPPALQSKRARWLVWCLLLASVGLLVSVCVYFAAAAVVRQSSARVIVEADSLLIAKDAKGVREALKWLLWFEPDHYEALLLWGLSFHVEEEYAEAIAVLERIPEKSKFIEEANIALATTLILDDQLERAEKLLDRHLELFPHSVVAMERLHWLYMKELRKRDAIELHEASWRLKPDDLMPLVDLLNLETTILTGHGPAIVLEKADRHHPNQGSVVLALAHAYQLMGKTKLAEAKYRAALALRPQDPRTRLQAAGFFLEIGDADTADRLLLTEETTGIPEVYSSDDRYWALRCRLALRLGELQAAGDHVTNALRLRPKEREYLSLKVELYRRLGRFQDAANVAGELTQLAKDWNRVLFLGANMEIARPKEEDCNEIAAILERVGRPDQAAGWRMMSRKVKYIEAMRLLQPASRAGRETTENGAP